MSASLNGRFKLFMVFFLLTAFIHAQEKLVKYIDPMIGTGGHGHTYPGATLPFGMMQLSPDTDIDGWDWCSGYHYSDNSIMGFTHTHLSGTGCADYGDILLMPTTGELKTEPGDKTKPGSGYRSKFDHKNEHAEAGYYSVLLDDYNVKAELTATLRAGLHKYTFPESGNSHIIIDVEHGIQDVVKAGNIEIADSKTIKGFRKSSGWGGTHTVYFIARFSKPFDSFGIVENGKRQDGLKTASGEKLKGFVNYKTSSGEVVLVKVGISFVSIADAQKNLDGEIPGWNFDAVKAKAQAAWEKELSKFTVESSVRNKTIFYTALYHALITPNVFSDINGNYMGMDDKVRHVKGKDIYTVFSLWDTFRAEHPLFTLLDTKRVSDMINTLLAKYDEHGLLPVWELAGYETDQMIGYHSIPVIADAYFKGIKGFDVNKAYEAMKKSAMNDAHGLSLYKANGYIDCGIENEGVSKTLEYCYDDWCIARMAKALGKTEDYNYFINRAKYYVNVFDPSTLLMRPKKNGRWLEPFDPYSVSGNYTEANAWQYSFFVPQDIDGLIKLIGGDEKFVSQLDTLFTASQNMTGSFQSDITGMIGQYAHGNEPSHHMAYLYNYAGAPWKTQERVNEILTKLYTEKTDGLCGNDDCGQMSAWYVLSAMGFYPVCPGDNTYVIGKPQFNKVTIKADGKKKFTIIANNLSDKNIYIVSAKLNGKNYPLTYIKHSDIMRGGTLVFEMGAQPGNWGKAVSARPKSAIDCDFVSIPVAVSGNKVFKDSVTMELSSVEKGTEIYYTTNGSDPVKNGMKYTTPIVITQTSTIKAVNCRNGKYSKAIQSDFYKRHEGWSIKLKNQYHNSYTGGGAIALIDGIKGTENFHSEPWQGYEGNDLDAVIDLGRLQQVKSIGARFLQETGSWIFYPQKIEYYVSKDGETFTKVFEENIPVDEKNQQPGIKDFTKTLEGTEARYIKVYAKNVGVCPAWHKGAGYKAWLFIDEVTIK